MLATMAEPPATIERADSTPAPPCGQSPHARPHRVDELAPEFAAEARELRTQRGFNAMQLFGEFCSRYGHHAVGRSSFYRWVADRLVEGRPAPIVEPRLPPSVEPPASDDGAADAAPDFSYRDAFGREEETLQSRVLLDLALRLPRDEIERLDAALSPLRAVGEITVPENAMLRAVCARQALDRATEGDALVWTI